VINVAGSLTEATLILSQCDVSADEPAEVAMDRMGLKLMQDQLN
jgi:hypothetical protein